jgi:hypothetical protein
MPASSAHDLIVALITRRIMQSGYDIAAIESSLDWLFGEGFRLPPAIIHHRPDVLGVRDSPPFLAIGDAKTTRDLGARRTSQQLLDYASLRVGKEQAPCWIVIGIPQSGAARLQGLIARLGIPHDIVFPVEVPDALLSGGEL